MNADTARIAERLEREADDIRRFGPLTPYRDGVADGYDQAARIVRQWAVLNDGSKVPDQCVDYGHHGRDRCVVCGIPRPQQFDEGNA